MGKRKGTPEDLDYLFERDIVDEEDYREFWSEYWQRDAKGRRELEKEYVDRYNEIESDLGDQTIGVVYRNRKEAEQQAQALSEMGTTEYRVTRRNARGQFSKRGTYYQAVRKHGQ
jgi:hypothetical protein